MANIVLKVFLVLVLISLPTSGQNSQQHLICKNVESVFSDGNDGSTVPHRRGIQGNPGKRGPSGEKGERGPIGDQGPPAIVDYEKIFEKINNKTRQGLQEINSRLDVWPRNITAELQAGLEEMSTQSKKLQSNNTLLAAGLQEVNSNVEKLQSKVDISVSNATGLATGIEKVNSEIEILRSNTTVLAAELGKISEQTTDVRNVYVKSQRCKDQNELIYDGKCYYAYISNSWNTNYNQAVQKCSSQNSLLAELHSLAYQKDIEVFFRSRVPSSRSFIFLWIGMTYQSSGRNLRFSSGKEVSVDQFKWKGGHPSGSYGEIAIYIRNDGDNSDDGIFNYAANNNVHGVICEKSL